MNSEKFIGVGTAMITPFDNNGKVDFDSLGKLIRYQLNNGTDYFVIMGTTSEYVTLTKIEQSEVLEFFIRENSGCLPIVLGIGGNCTEEVVLELKTANLDGVDAVLSVVPYYNKPSQEGIYQHYKAISENSPLPVILYNVPGRTGVNMTAETTLRLQKEFSNLIAIKEASGNINQIDYILRDKRNDFLVLSGEDNLAFISTVMGGSGVISVSSNAFPKQMSNLIHSALAYDITKSKEIQKSLLEITDLLFTEGNPVGIKAALTIKGLVKNNLRLPLVKSSDMLYTKIEDNMRKWNL